MIYGMVRSMSPLSKLLPPGRRIRLKDFCTIGRVSTSEKKEGGSVGVKV